MQSSRRWMKQRMYWRNCKKATWTRIWQGSYTGDYAVIKEKHEWHCQYDKGLYRWNSKRNWERNSAGQHWLSMFIREYRGDFAALKESINKILTSLNEIMSRINTRFWTGSIRHKTERLRRASQAISQGASEQCKPLWKELSTTITQFAEQTKQNAISAE